MSASTRQPALGLRFRLEAGRWADYRALARHHYRAAPPATVHSVWRMTAEDEADSPCPGAHACGVAAKRSYADRPPGGTSPESANPKSEIRNPKSLLWRFGGYPRVAGVLVVSRPVLASAARNAVTARRYCTCPDRREGIVRLNREVLTISRVIVHPLYRGLGLAPRLVRGAIERTAEANADLRLIEAFARMGHYVPFFESAGMGSLSLPGRPVYYHRLVNGGISDEA